MKIGDPVFCVNVNLYIKPNRRDEFLKVIKANQLGTLSSEPLAILYTWGQSAVDENIFYFQEQYHGKEGFEAHTKSRHFEVWEAFTRTDPFSKPPEVMLFEEFK
jgi:quinol monooxygenase YgiN